MAQPVRRTSINSVRSVAGYHSPASTSRKSTLKPRLSRDQATGLLWQRSSELDDKLKALQITQGRLIEELFAHLEAHGETILELSRAITSIAHHLGVTRDELISPREVDAPTQATSTPQKPGLPETYSLTDVLKLLEIKPRVNQKFIDFLTEIRGLNQRFGKGTSKGLVTGAINGLERWFQHRNNHPIESHFRKNWDLIEIKDILEAKNSAMLLSLWGNQPDASSRALETIIEYLKKQEK